MNRRLAFPTCLVILLSLTGLWTSPAAGRLYPPTQNIGFTLDTPYTIRYWVNVGLSGVAEQTWSVPQADERVIIPESAQFEQGVLTWIAKYKNSGVDYYTYEVHFRIYDPSRDTWKAGSWGPFSGPQSSVYRLQVKDGVVCWNSFRLNGSPPWEYRVVYATYDPQFGSWTWDHVKWQMSPNWSSQVGPGLALVKNGIVAWPMEPSMNQTTVDFYFVTYDQELHKWISRPEHLGYAPFAFKGADVVADTAQVHIGFYHYPQGWLNFYYGYDPYNHQWVLSLTPNPIRRAYFVAQPDSGFVPFCVYFWDCSTALDGVTAPSTWDWIIAPGPTFINYLRGFGWVFSNPGPYLIQEIVNYSGFFDFYSAEGAINAQMPDPTKISNDGIGGISINNGAAYTNSLNVTLSFFYDPSFTQMCFREAPGLNLWSSWEPVAHSKAWTLSTIGEFGASPDGPHTVYVKFRDQNGIESQPYSYTITLVTTPPAALLLLDLGAAETTNRNVQVLCLAASDYPMEMSYCYFEEVNGWGWSIWSTPVPYPSLWPLYTVIPFTASTSQKPVMVAMVQFKDIAGNITQLQQSIALKPPPMPHLLLLLGD